MEAKCPFLEWELGILCVSLHIQVSVGLLSEYIAEVS